MIRHILLVSLLIHCTLAQPKGGKPISPPLPKRTWLTLHGDEPVVVANGGYSGLLPAQTDTAFSQANALGKRGTVLLCDLHMSRDGLGFCLSQLNIQNTTNAADAFPNRRKTYIVNGKEIQGWFALDFIADELYSKLQVTQSIFSRTDLFDFSPPTPTDLFLEDNMKSLVWINAEYATFYSQHKLSLLDHIKQLLEIKKDISYISSPEIGFLKSMGAVVRGLRTKLMFKFPADTNAVEPTTNETYASLLTKLSMIKTFAAGIVVPREYIWPVSKARYLEPSTNLVADAHKLGLEVFSYGFANDNYLPYNYTYDPQREYLQFVDNSLFAVDGVITDFTMSASMAIACLAGTRNASRKVPTLIISSNGANGDYPGATDLAYQKAVDDGVDIIDCSVQMTKDGVALCLPSIDLTPSTTAAGPFMSRAAKVDPIQSAMGIFSFDLTWEEIQSLKPQMSGGFNGELARDPARKNVGKFVTLSDFLEFAKAKAVPGVLINIENAAYLASNKGLDIVGTVTTALSNATLDKNSTQKVLIMSSESSVLDKFKAIPTYQRVLHIKEQVGFVTNETALEVKKYADAVLLHKHSIYSEFRQEGLTFNLTNLISCLHWANVSVYAANVLNEFQDIFMDFGSDPYLLIHNLINYGADGIVTQYPSTASAYSRNLCTGNPDAYKIQDLNPGDVIAVMLDPKEVAEYKPPPLVHFETKNFVTPPLPPVADIAKDDGGSTSNSTSNANTTDAPSPSPPPPPAQAASSATAPTINGAALFFATMLGLVYYKI
ncbi:PREDICTED: glycerophosphodiester phosphodiesterase GDPDL7-like isoform X1 [Nicotiana attenuata]|uniref:glycerophosphodiester phosphodiesterase GDPDL7-like isoform X1 n=1 Tax=Nicotiana attenuata TaxID=49451 RepID=UPI000904EC80|nr:PREDICTED: glycerophosphodiester phosphodiesterase GDPDL7-like isoform X1 [Nicotiana attenuata]